MYMLGVPLAMASVRLLQHLAPVDVPRLVDTSIDFKAVLFAAAASKTTHQESLEQGKPGNSRGATTQCHLNCQLAGIQLTAGKQQAGNIRAGQKNQRWRG